MVAFAVRHEGQDEDQGSWVLAVDPAGERLLLADADGSLHWHLMSTCKLIKASTPDMPRAVIAVQPQTPIQLPSSFPANGHRRN